jgi:hypothetical protein
MESLNLAIIPPKLRQLDEPNWAIACSRSPSHCFFRAD